MTDFEGKPLYSHQLRCVRCSADLIVPVRATGERAGANGIFCQCCGVRFDAVDGIPFIGDYEAQDFVGLVEVVATSDQPTTLSADYVRVMNGHLEAYHGAADKEAFAAGHGEPMLRQWWWGHRYHEWLQASCIIADEPLDGARLLNVGAGTGSDAVRLIDAGAQVTCIDHSPTLTSMGQAMLPEADWVGGFSHVLPFQSETFDVVCANAELHHMRSVPDALREMLRVLKPGGLMFTTGDPIRSDFTPPDDHEFIVFDRHEAVLGGVNERMIPFGEIYDTLAALGADIEVELMADIVGGPDLAGGTRIEGGFNDHWIPLTPENVERLRHCFGSVATRIRKRASLALDAPLQTQSFISASCLTSWIQAGTAYTELAGLAPREFVDHPFPGERQTWFDLLNGWLRPEPPFEMRQGFKRARWLLRVPKGACKLAFEAKCAIGASRRASIFANGIELTSVELSDAWRTVEVAVDAYADTVPVLFEIRLEEAAPGLSFDENSFLVRSREFAYVVSSWTARLGGVLKRRLVAARGEGQAA